MTASDIKKIIPGAEVLEGEPMSRHTTFKVGGCARLFVTLSDEEDIVRLIAALKEAGEKFEIIGRGSNLLVSDEGYDGVIICINNKDAKAEILMDAMGEGETMPGEGETMPREGAVTFYAPAGMSLITLSTMARDASLTGLEFACGIPGTIGGAIIMNAGAYGGEIADVVTSVRAVDTNGDVREYSREEMKFRYRGSYAMDAGLVVLGATFALKRGEKEEIAETMKENLSKRSSAQPLEYPNAGSTFKRPEGDFAGRLIEEAGLKGFSIGGAQVSTKHAGFIVNTGEATATDILALTDHVINTVYEKTGVKLELEIRKLGA